MAFLGVLIAVVGVVGFILNFTGVLKLTGPLGNPATFAIAAVVGVVLFFLTRRPSD